MAQQPLLARRPTPVAVAALAFLVCAVFFPIVDFEFIDLDVKTTVVENEHIRGLTGENLKYIFTSRCLTSYYPVRTLTYAMDYEFWGLNAGGFKFTNGVIHLTNVYLVFWLVLRLLRLPAPRRQIANKGKVVRYVLAGRTWPLRVFARPSRAVVEQKVAWVPGSRRTCWDVTLGCLGLSGIFHMTAHRLSSRRPGDKPGRDRR